MVDYLSKEKGRLAIWFLIYSVIILVSLFLIPIEFFFSRLNFDSLNYYLIGKHFAETLWFDVRIAENVSILPYVGWPGYLRLPLFLLSRNPEVCLRAIQISNLGIAMGLSVFYSYALSKVLPDSLKTAAIPLSLFLLTFSNYWAIDLALPLGDNLFSLTTLSTIFLLRSYEEDSSRFLIGPLGWLVVSLLILISILIKITGVFLLIFVINAVRFKVSGGSISRRVVFVATILLLFLVLFLAYSSIGPTIIGRYAPAWLKRFNDQHTQFLSLWFFDFICLSLPSQIVPHLGYFFPGHEVVPVFHFLSGHIWQKVIVLVVGMTISTMIFIGMWMARKRFAPELLYFVIGLPIYVPITTSTMRYLSYSQVFILVFFFIGTGAIVQRFRRFTLPKKWRRGLILLSIGLFLILSISIRLLSGTSSKTGNFGLYWDGIIQTSTVYRELNRFLLTMPRESTRIIMVHPGQSRWKALCGLEYHAPAKDLPWLSEEYNLLLVLDASGRDGADLIPMEAEATQAMKPFGSYELQTLFAMDNTYAHARVFRVRMKPLIVPTQSDPR